MTNKLHPDTLLLTQEQWDELFNPICMICNERDNNCNCDHRKIIDKAWNDHNKTT